VTTVVPKRRGVGGIAVHADGGFICSGRDLLHVREGDEARTVLHVDGVAGWNDLCTDADGNVYAGALRFAVFDPAAEVVPGELWRVGAAGDAAPFVTDIVHPNGVAWTPDGATLYVSDTRQQRLIVFEPATGSRRDVDVSALGHPDGMAVDEHGAVWLALVRGGIARLTPDGDVDQVLEPPSSFTHELLFRRARSRRDDGQPHGASRAGRVRAANHARRRRRTGGRGTRLSASLRFGAANEGEAAMALRNAELQRLRKHRVPAWWRDAKLGIFVHWTIASIPAFRAGRRRHRRARAGRSRATRSQYCPYAEWYENSLRFPDSPSRSITARSTAAALHDVRGGVGGRARAVGPDEWAARFAATGARYVVFVTKHMDGYCLWPTGVPNPHRPGWNCRRDVVGELGEAVRGAGMRFGLYYSGGLDSTFNTGRSARSRR
jgi:hypothetical protein